MSINSKPTTLVLLVNFIGWARAPPKLSQSPQHQQIVLLLSGAQRIVLLLSGAQRCVLVLGQVFKSVAIGWNWFKVLALYKGRVLRCIPDSGGGTSSAVLLSYLILSSALRCILYIPCFYIYIIKV